MYMKKIYFLIATVTAMMMASCTIEQDDFFSDSSANRADNAIAADVQVLTSAANGWLMQYFPDSQQSYGGYNEIIRFKADGKAEILGEAYSDSIYTSLYSVTQSAGIVLTFDSYNPEFHAFSDPSAPIGGSEGTGWDGDFDFSILKCTAEEVVLKGKKTGNKIVMTPMPTSDWEAYLNGIWDVEDGMNAKKYGIHIGGEEIIAMRLNRTLIMDYEDNGEEYEVTASYIITPQGFKFKDIETCYMKAMDDGITATDDTALASMYGLKVYLTKGLYSNLKITTPEDIAIASEIIRSRGESEPFHD